MNSDKTEQEFSTDSLDDLLTLIKENSPSLGIFRIHTDSCFKETKEGEVTAFPEIQIFHDNFIVTNNFHEVVSPPSPQFKFQYSADIISTLLKAIANNSSIITFDFSYVFEHYEFSDLLFMLRENSSIKRIYCRNIKHDLEQTIPLFEQLASKSYESIFLGGFDFNSDNLEIFFQTLLSKNPSLQSLRLGGNVITPKCVSLIQKSLPFLTNLRDLDLGFGRFCTGHDKAIANSLKDNYVLTSFTHLNQMPLCDELVARNKEAQEQKLFKTVKQASY